MAIQVGCPNCCSRQSLKNDKCSRCDTNLSILHKNGSAKYYHSSHQDGKHIYYCIGNSIEDAIDHEAYETLNIIYFTMRDIRRKEINRLKYQGGKKTELTRQKRMRAALEDPYIKKLLTKESHLSHRDVPNALVELKRLELYAKRELKNLKGVEK